MIYRILTPDGKAHQFPDEDANKRLGPLEAAAKVVDWERVNIANLSAWEIRTWADRKSKLTYRVAKQYKVCQLRTMTGKLLCEIYHGDVRILSKLALIAKRVLKPNNIEDVYEQRAKERARRRKARARKLKRAGKKPVPQRRRKSRR